MALAPPGTKPCGAKGKRSGEPCPNAPMTNGSGKCYHHGGKAGGPIKHGRYSVKHRASLARAVEDFRNDPEPGNLLDELALQRALTQDLIDRVPDGVAMPLEYVQALSGFLSETSRLVERIAKVEAQRQIAAGDAAYLLEAVADIITQFVPDHDRSRAIESLRARLVPRPVGGQVLAAAVG